MVTGLQQRQLNLASPLLASQCAADVLLALIESSVSQTAAFRVCLCYLAVNNKGGTDTFRCSGVNNDASHYKSSQGGSGHLHAVIVIQQSYRLLT